MKETQRVVIENVTPEIDSGRFPVKRVVGEKVVVEADIFADGHDDLSAVLRFKKDDAPRWTEIPMEFVNNDRWRGEFIVTEMGRWSYTIKAWVDHFATWAHFLDKKVEAGQDVSVDILVGVKHIEEARQRASRDDRTFLGNCVDVLTSDVDISRKTERALSEEIRILTDKYSKGTNATTYDKKLSVDVDRLKARFSSWYEVFPRSCSNEPGLHGTFRDVEDRLSYIADMGFDVLYLPPIHPIGTIHRKGKNNEPAGGPDAPGSPWAIGSAEGGHKAIHPQLGTMADFHRLIKSAGEHGLEIALDLAYQCTPDHPYVTEHPEWFLQRPDGTIQYAENPPKKYQDIYPFNFETENRQELRDELKNVILFWIEQGVRIFRVDNPHTKPFHFWEWFIGEIKKDYPDVIFLAEAFTRPKVMYRLAKLGFTQSYTYFTWRNSSKELTDYFSELTQTDVHDFFRPNLWPNTPDILHKFLQDGGRPAFMIRLVLAATLGASYGIYGPAFELCENIPREEGSEEYLNSEKYEIKNWDIDRPDSLKEFIGRVNHIRRENPALQSNATLHFHRTDNDGLLCYSKQSDDGSNVILTVINLHHEIAHSGWVELDLEPLKVYPGQSYGVRDLLDGSVYQWNGSKNYVALDPRHRPAHIFRLEV